MTEKFLDTLAGVILVAALTAGPIALFVMFSGATPQPAKAPPAQVLRRLELRIDEPLDKTHSSAGGERYRRFECTEVPR